MPHVKQFTFNPFQENTYLLYNDSGDCLIVDPGCSNATEERQLSDFIESKKLTVKHLINTHAHLDHVLGNAFVVSRYHVGLYIHRQDIPTLKSAKAAAHLYGISYDESPEPAGFLEAGTIVDGGVGNQWKVLFAPGHAPGHIMLFHEESRELIAGDVIFRQSIGRTDLPGGNHQQLLDSIVREVYTLPLDTVIHPGHGPTTTVDYERKFNPFVQG